LNGPGLVVWLALLGCIVGGIRGGRLLAATFDAEAQGPWTSSPVDTRAFAAALLTAHAAAAAVLGYNAFIGEGMALALGLGWIAAAAVRFWHARKLGQRPNGAVVELLTGVVLALPAWASMAPLARGSFT
jgi:hypothetical protein